MGDASACAANLQTATLAEIKSSITQLASKDAVTQLTLASKDAMTQLTLTSKETATQLVRAHTQQANICSTGQLSHSPAGCQLACLVSGADCAGPRCEALDSEAAVDLKYSSFGLRAHVGHIHGAENVELCHLDLGKGNLNESVRQVCIAWPSVVNSCRRPIIMIEVTLE